MADLELSILANTRQLQKEVGTDVPKALEKVADSLDDMARDGADAGEKLERSFREIADSAKKESKKVGDSFGDNTKRGFQRAEGGLKDFKRESESTARESAASFDGSAQSIGDAFQEVSANAFSGFGPAGAVAGLAAAAGIGLVSSALITAQEDADELKARIASAYQTAVEEGRNYLDEAQILKGTIDIMFGEDQGLYQQAQRDAADLGITTGEVVKALAGDQDALNLVLARTNELEAERGTRIAESKSPMDTRAELMSSEGQALKEINDRYTLQQSIQQGNVDKANELLDVSSQNTIKIQERNDELARTPKTVKTTLEVDDSAIGRALSSRTLRVDIEGYTRHGERAF